MLEKLIVLNFSFHYLQYSLKSVWFRLTAIFTNKLKSRKKYEQYIFQEKY